MREKISVKQMNFFKQGESAMNPEDTISGDNVHHNSEEDMKTAWMREKRISLLCRCNSRFAEQK